MAGCIVTSYCVSSGGNPFDGDYSNVGTYLGYDLFSGDSVPYYIFYSNTENCWCLSSSIGGTCLQFGQTGSATNCPDLDESFFFSGVCPTTTTTTTSPCNTFDFAAYFDCLVPTTTTTTTAAPTTTTTTTVPFDPCSGVSINVTITAYTTTTTTIPVTTTTTTIVRPCNFDGLAQFNLFDEFMRCGNTKRFRDCITGFDYYSSDLIFNESGSTLIQNYVYKTTINGLSACVTFMGLVDNISGTDDVVINETLGLESLGFCLSCLPDPPPPPPPCDCYVLFGGNAFFGAKFGITNCDSGLPEEYNLGRGATGYTCSTSTPTILIGTGAEILTNSGSCDTVLCQAPPPPPPPPPCVLIEYHISNDGIVPHNFTYTDCNGETITGDFVVQDVSVNICSATVPIANPPGSLQIGPLIGNSCP